ncbi:MULTISPECIES: DUF6221 family protein [unclassified Streptomyces]|uniref:DUF6221 family protein n=1 Tax=unclassified Streptomyces TaxID=2593676 RepID=UPI003445E32C
MTDDLVTFLSARLDEDEQIAREADPDLSAVFTRIECFDTEMAADERHIMAHGPSRVLREIDAKRELLSRYEAMTAGLLVMTGVEAILAEYRRVLLPHLALPYADHPDYREEWRA